MIRRDSKEVWAKCQQCGTELKQGDKVCPKCGSTKKMFNETGHEVIIVAKTGASVEHEAHWSSESWAILGIIITLFAVLLTLIWPWLTFAIRIGILVTILIIGLVIGFNNKTRYSLLMFIRWLDTKFIARKKYRGK